MTRNDVIHEKTVAAVDSPDHINCERWKLEAVRNNKIVKNIISKINKTKNFKFENSCISCEFCPNSGLKGGLTSDPEILLCENSLKSASEVETVLSHELVHFLDHLNNTDWTDIKALARSEIRAAKYSLECHNQYGAQLWEGNQEHPQLCSISKRFKQCVRDRATDSVRLVTNVGSFKARSIVDEVFEKSYSEEL